MTTVSGMARKGKRGRAAALAAVLAFVLGGGIAALVAGGGDKASLDLAVRNGDADPVKGAGRIPGARVPADVRTRVNSLSRERKVAQLFLVGIEGKYPGEPFEVELKRRDWGGVMLEARNYADAGQLGGLASEVAQLSRAKGRSPALIAARQDGGAETAFAGLPPSAQPKVNTPALARSEATAAAQQLRGAGVALTTAPVADVGVAAGAFQQDVFSDDAGTVTRLVRAAVDGYRAGQMLTAVGHFPGQGSATDDPAFENASVGLPLADLRARDMRPFKAIAHRTAAIQLSNASYAAFDGVTPASIHPKAVALLRKDLAFRGVIMTGDLAITAEVAHESIGAVAVQALQAGADMLWLSGPPKAQEQAFRAVLAAVRAGKLRIERVQQAALRVTELKREAGLLG
jgi:beta-N-acetylhexosaminidase